MLHVILFTVFEVSYFSVSTVHIIIIIIKVKFTLEQATKAHKGSRGIALLFL